MIELHRRGQAADPLFLNPDLISTVEAHPDTVVTLTTGVKLLVAESPEDVVDRVREFRTGILRDALASRHLRPV